MIKEKVDANLEGKPIILMDSKSSWPSEAAILSLLDDESPVVRDSIVRLFREFPHEGRLFLKNITHESNGIVAKNAKELQHKLGWTDGKEDFLNFIRSSINRNFSIVEISGSQR